MRREIRHGVRRTRASARLLLGLLLSLPMLDGGAAEAAPCDLSKPEPGTVVQVDDGETVKLADGTVVRLIGAKAPAAPLGWQGNEPWPLVEESKEELSRLALGKDVELRYGGTRSDRYGHALAQVFVVSGGPKVWLQGQLVDDGLARVYSFPDNRACVDELLALEEEARHQRLGVWSSWAYAIVGADEIQRLDRLGHSYQIVEGAVAAVGEAGPRVYLNFGKDWRTDFTLEIDRKDKPAFKLAGIDLAALAGKRLRARGWLEWRNGPMIAITHPEQIELLADDGVPEPAASESGQAAAKGDAAN